MDFEVNAESNFYTDEFKTDYENNLDSEVTYNKSLLSGLCSDAYHVLMLPSTYQVEYYVPENTADIIEFDMIHSSPLTNLVLATIDQRFLTSAAN